MVCVCVHACVWAFFVFGQIDYVFNVLSYIIMQTWIKLVISGPSCPVERHSHTACYMGRSPQGHPQLIISGGTGGDNVPLGDEWVLDINESTGKLLYNEVSKHVYPSVV